MRPGILLDRDGTIIVDYHYVGHLARVQFIPGAIEAIRRFNEAGIPVAIITNQSGVARGFYPVENVIRVHAYMIAQLRQHGAHVDGFYYSPHHPDGVIPAYICDSYDHKPNPGMALRAIRDLDLDQPNCIVVGDRPEDVLMAHRIGAHAVYLGTQPTKGVRSEEYVRFSSLSDAAGYIIERITGVPQSSFPTIPYSDLYSYFVRYHDEVINMLRRVRLTDLNEVSNVLFKAASDGSHIFIAGNGGSAAIAEHFTADLHRHLGMPGSLFYTNVTSLCSNTPVLTAVANDIGFDTVFSYQLEHLATMGDVLVVFSVSGNSPNILRALQAAHEMNIMTVAIVGSNGGKAATMAERVVHIPHDNYGVVEDVMQIIAHCLAQYLRQSHMTDKQIQSATF